MSRVYTCFFSPFSQRLNRRSWLAHNFSLTFSSRCVDVLIFFPSEAQYSTEIKGGAIQKAIVCTSWGEAGLPPLLKVYQALAKHIHSSAWRRDRTARGERGRTDTEMKQNATRENGKGWKVTLSNEKERKGQWRTIEYEKDQENFRKRWFIEDQCKRVLYIPLILYFVTFASNEFNRKLN